MMNLEQLKKDLVKYANQDLTTARKRNCVGVCQTKIGYFDLSYDSENRIYTVRGMKIPSPIQMKKAEAVQFLISNYDVRDDAGNSIAI